MKFTLCLIALAVCLSACQTSEPKAQETTKKKALKEITQKPVAKKVTKEKVNMPDDSVFKVTGLTAMNQKDTMSLMTKLKPVWIKLQQKGWPAVETLMDHQKYASKAYAWDKNHVLVYAYQRGKGDASDASNSVALINQSSQKVLYARGQDDYKMEEAFSFFDGGGKSKHLLRTDSMSSGTCSGGKTYKIWSIETGLAKEVYKSDWDTTRGGVVQFANKANTLVIRDKRVNQKTRKGDLVWKDKAITCVWNKTTYDCKEKVLKRGMQRKNLECFDSSIE